MKIITKLLFFCGFKVLYQKIHTFVTLYLNESYYNGILAGNA